MPVNNVNAVVEEISMLSQRYTGLEERPSPTSRIARDLQIEGHDFLDFVEEVEKRFEVSLSSFLGTKPSPPVDPRSLSDVVKSMIQALLAPQEAKDPTIADLADFICVKLGRNPGGTTPN